MDAWPHDTRRILPEDLRPQMKRVLNANRRTGESEPAVAPACARARLRPHPFDLPRMDGLVHRYSQYLGVVAQYWGQCGAKIENQRAYFDTEPTTAVDRTEAPIAARVAFLDRLRTVHAADARAALVQVWGREPAESRLRLIGALQRGSATRTEPSSKRL